MSAHRPVMLEAALAGLAVRQGGTYVDATYGRGGHTAAILAQLQGTGMLHAFDQDPEACADAVRRFSSLPNFRIHAANFDRLGAIASGEAWTHQVAGALFDLGVSSPQLDDPSRGFSFMRDGPLDMRMDPGAGEPASAWLARAKDVEIADVLWRYGEERHSRRIARAIVADRVETPFETTSQLAGLIARVIPGARQKIHPATRSFQAIRLFINRELEVLESALGQAAEVLAPGGRMAVISFHSLEDRIVKRFIRDSKVHHAGADEGFGAAPSKAAPTRPLLKAILREFPAEDECAVNPRARSAVLRVAEKVGGVQ